MFSLPCWVALNVQVRDHAYPYSQCLAIAYCSLALALSLSSLYLKGSRELFDPTFNWRFNLWMLQ